MNHRSAGFDELYVAPYEALAQDILATSRQVGGVAINSLNDILSTGRNKQTFNDSIIEEVRKWHELNEALIHHNHLFASAGLTVPDVSEFEQAHPALFEDLMRTYHLLRMTGDEPVIVFTPTICSGRECEGFWETVSKGVGMSINGLDEIDYRTWRRDADRMHSLGNTTYSENETYGPIYWTCNIFTMRTFDWEGWTRQGPIRHEKGVASIGENLTLYHIQKLLQRETKQSSPTHPLLMSHYQERELAEIFTITPKLPSSEIDIEYITIDWMDEQKFNCSYHQRYTKLTI